MSESIPPDPIPTPPDDEIPLTPSTGSASPPLPPITPLPPVTYESAAVAPLLPPATKDEQTMGMLAHLLGIFTFFLGPLIIWLIKKDESKYIDEQAKEVLNFQIGACIVIFGCMIFIVVPFLGFCIALPLSLAAHVTRLVISIIGTINASKALPYRYPLTYRFIK